MDSNMTLEIGFKGTAKLNGEVMPLQEGYHIIGGIVASTQSAGLKFGVVASCSTTDIHQFYAGLPSGNIVRGITVFDNSRAQHQPAGSDVYYPATNCAVLTEGYFRMHGWNTTDAGVSAPALGAKVGFKTDSGELAFYTGTLPSGYTALKGATIVDIDDDDGSVGADSVVVYFNIANN